MCGIVGYIGEKNSVPVILDGLTRLEYRGYDSAGIAVLKHGRIIVHKKKGKLDVLKRYLASKDLSSPVGLGHTRWATHGEPSDVNAHPHTDCTGKFVVVHNGIIENYHELKKRLQKKGHRFLSQTDTEVISHLIEEYYKGDLKEAVFKTLNAVEGAYAIGVLSKYEPDKIVAARLGSPLVIGIGKNENFIASDVPAILNRTKEVIYLADGEVAVLTKDQVKIFGRDSKPRHAKISTVTWDQSQAQKSGYKHFMLKEINEQPQAITNTFLGRITPDDKGVVFEKDVEELLNRDFLKSIKSIIIVSCGTAYHAGLVGEYLIEKYAKLHVGVDLSSEFRYRDPDIDKDTLLIVVSQSGETADTLAALRLAKKQGAKILSICNVQGSSIARESDAVIYTQAGPEIAVASTKAYTSQLTAFVLLTVYMGRATGVLSRSAAAAIIKDLKVVPGLIKSILDDKDAKNTLRRIAAQYRRAKYFLYLGRNINYPTALEAALKLKEICYISSEGYAAGEMKHGPIALAYDKRPVVCVAPASKTYDKMFSNIQEVKARHADIIAVATRADRRIGEFADHVAYVPAISEALSPFLAIIPLQLLAYYISVELGYDPDKPRNLAKSVTVE